MKNKLLLKFIYITIYVVSYLGIYYYYDRELVLLLIAINVSQAIEQYHDKSDNT